MSEGRRRLRDLWVMNDGGGADNRLVAVSCHQLQQRVKRSTLHRA